LPIIHDDEAVTRSICHI